MFVGSIHPSGTGALCSRAARLALLFLLLTGTPLLAATLTATLDRDTVIVGESATLTLTFEGGEPDAFPQIEISNLRVVGRGSSRGVSILNNQVTSTISQTFALIPLAPGVYEIPPLKTTVQGQQVASQPLKLTAVKPDGAAAGQGGELSFMRLFIPQKEVFVGQPIAVELQVFVRDGILNAEDILRAFDNYNSAPISAEGCRILRTAHLNRRRAANEGAAYNVSTLVTAISPAKPGRLTIESIKVPLTLQLPVAGQRRRDIFDPFGMFQQSQPREVVLAAAPETIEVLPLPAQNVPKGFSGAAGSFSLSMNAGPTNVAVGDPITVKIRIEGRGDLEGLTLPDQPAWSGFKTYPATSLVETKDPLGLQGAKIFEQVIVPQSENVKELPAMTFSFFDPEKKAYQSLTSSTLPLTVRPGGSTPAPVIAVNRGQREEEPPPAPDIVPIKRKPGSACGPAKPLIRQPLFLGLQLIPVLLLAGASIWRRRADEFAANPRLRRKRQVERKVQSALADLRRYSSESKSDEFFLTVFRLLQEQLGERMDVPSASITEAVVSERLRPRGVPESVLEEIQKLFHACDQARYAPLRSSQQLEALVPQVENVLGKIRNLKL